MRITTVCWNAVIKPLDDERVIVKGEMNRSQLKRHLFSILRSNEWVNKDVVEMLERLKELRGMYPEEDFRDEV